MENAHPSRHFSPLVERALRVAARFHRQQSRKASDLPYITHPAGVALVLLSAGFHEEHVLAAGLLHDTLEDTDYTPEELAADFPPEVVEIVAALSEEKLDDAGRKRPWRDRKQDHIAAVATAAPAARAVVLADKLHNLGTMLFDLNEGHDIWERFNAPAADVLWYQRTMVDTAAGVDDPRIGALAAECRAIIDKLAESVPADN